VAPDALASGPTASPRARAAALAVEAVASWSGEVPCSIPTLVAQLVERHGLTRNVAVRAVDDAADDGKLILTPIHPAGEAWFIRVNVAGSPTTTPRGTT
jgi:hypothetical protein